MIPPDPVPRDAIVNRLPLLAVLLLLTACRSTTESLRIMYGNSVRDRTGEGNFSRLDVSYLEQQERRHEIVRGYIKDAKLVSAEDYLYAGVILSTSGADDDLVAAGACGLKAAELGEERGFRVAAEAVDRRLMLMGRSQRYGTQYYYLEVIQKWRLYPVDPKTTDAERLAMGVETLAELRAREDELNAELR